VSGGPARADRGASRGAHATCLSIGGLTFRIVSDDPRLVSSREYDALHAFSVADAVVTRADVHVVASWTDAPPRIDGELVFDSGGSWQLRRADGDFLFTLKSTTGGGGIYKTARFDRAFTRGDVRLQRSHFEPGANLYPLQYPLDELVMIHLLSQGRGIELHGCALVDDARRGYVFPGQSGAGKSTLARLWAGRPEVTLLTDERVIVRTDGDGLTVFGTPWHGDAMLASPRAGGLRAVFFLEHHPSHEVVPIAPPVAAARLLACAFLPFHAADAVERTIAAAEQIARAVPCYALRFAPDRSVVDVIAAHMG
jgi:hypothetical protein